MTTRPARVTPETQALDDDLAANSIHAHTCPEAVPKGEPERPAPQPSMPSRDTAMAAPVRWKDQPEVDDLQALLEEILGTTFQVRQAARALLQETQGNYARLHKILLEYKADRKFCDWAQRVGLRAFAFRGMALTRYHATPKRKASKDWYERNKQFINR